MTKKSKIILLAIFLIGIFVRGYQLGMIPMVVNRDEAALGYNAYLLLETGKDEWGKSWPIFFESFGDYKLPGYIFSLVALFGFLPINDLVLRIPSMMAGVVLIIVAYLWVKKEKLDQSSQLFVALSFALTPIFIFYSRIAFEANMALAIFFSALYLLLHDFKSRLRVDLLALILVLLAVFTYNTPLILLPLVIPLIPLLRGIKDLHKWAIPVAGLFIIFISVYLLLAPLTAQKDTITIFADETVWTDSVTYREQFTGIWQTILGNKYLFMAQILFKNIVLSLSPTFLVKLAGEHPWHNLPNKGHIYSITYLLFWVGIFGLLNLVFKRIFQLSRRVKNKEQKIKELIKILLPVYLLLVGLAPAVITVDAPHATRSLLFFVFFVLISGEGFSYLLAFFKSNRFRYSFMILILLAIFFSSSNYLYDYFFNFNNKISTSLEPSLPVVLKEVEQKYPDQKIAVVDNDGYDYIYLAWFLKIDPMFYLYNNVRQQANHLGFKYGERVGRYHFIARKEDRAEDEKILLQGEGYQWEVIEY